MPDHACPECGSDWGKDGVGCVHMLIYCEKCVNEAGEALALRHGQELANLMKAIEPFAEFAKWLRTMNPKDAFDDGAWESWFEAENGKADYVHRGHAIALLEAFEKCRAKMGVEK